MKRFIGCADEILCNSNFTADEIRPLTEKPIHIVPLGLDIGEFNREKYYDKNLQRTLSGDGKKKILIHVGRLDKDKKIDLLIDFAKLLDQKKYILVVAGGGREEKRLREISCVKVTGYINHEEVKQYLSISDIGVLVNDVEPFGLVALEMMAFGLPILGPNKGGLSGILDDSFSRRLPYNAQAYFEALENLEKVKDTKALADRARKVFLEKYTSYAMVERLLKIYSPQQNIPSR